MSNTVRVLVVEDSEDDTRLALRVLERAEMDITWERVQDAAGLQAALKKGPWDVVISDYRMPGFSGMDALRICQDSGMDIPFILISGAIGEETAVAAMKAGANDYMMKGHLARLAPAVKRELREAANRAERRRVQQDLIESENNFRQMAESIHEVFFLIDPELHQVFYVSPAFEDIWGRSREALYAAPQSWADSIHPDDRVQAQADFARRDAAGRFDFTNRILRPDGTQRWIRTQGFPITNARGEIYRYAGISEDITAQKEQQQRITRLSRIYAVLSGVNSAIVRIHERQALLQEVCRVAVEQGAFSMAWVGLIDPQTLDGKVVAWFGQQEDYLDQIILNARAETTDSDRPANVALRENRAVICNDVGNEPTLARFAASLLGHGHHALAALPLRMDDQLIGVIHLFAGEVNFFDEQEIKLVNELAGDLSFGLQFISKEEQLNYVAFYDALTGLPNRTLLLDRLAQMLLVAERDNAFVAVIALNIDNFGRLNDALGRFACDNLLKQLGERLMSALQEPFSVARMGGDSFAIVLPGLLQATDAGNILEQRIFAACQPPFMLANQETRLELHAGIAVYPEDGKDAESLLKEAALALNKAKSAGERFMYHAPQMNFAVAARLALESDLRTALTEEQFLVYYQPRIDLVSGRIVSAEALIRWQQPQRGLVPPSQFIALAEETGLIAPISTWVINAVYQQQLAWQASQADIVPIAINLSAVQFKKGRVLQSIREAKELYALTSNFIEFELTESMLMEDPDVAVYNLQALKEMGFKLSLDDFGTGYSSLAYLKRFPFDFVKIDRAFILDIIGSKEGAAIAVAIIAMAHALNLRAVAEGAETQEQVDFLRQNRCDELQGNVFSPPVTAAQFEAMLREERKLSINPSR